MNTYIKLLTGNGLHVLLIKIIQILFVIIPKSNTFVENQLK